jgi:manganese/iron transport system ATP-binding protein
MSGLNVNDITVIYKNGHTAIYDASFSLPRGSITALVGVNGSGKSTLFKSIMGFVSLAKGSVQILGSTVSKARSRNQVAYVPQKRRN